MSAWGGGKQKNVGAGDNQHESRRNDNLVEAVEVPFQNAFSHGGGCPTPRVCRGNAQGRRAAYSIPHLRVVLIRSISGSGRRVHSRGRWCSGLWGRRRSIGGVLEKGPAKTSAKREATQNTCTTSMLRFDHRWSNTSPRWRGWCPAVAGPACSSTTLV